MLNVKSTANQKEIKLAYYKLAKKYHPDFQTESSESSQKSSEEMFKKILKAYEVLSNPMSRQAYDIENKLNQDTPLDQSTYADSISNKNYMQPRTQTDFYHTKWTGYKKPDWYHPFNGRDARSEYLYRKTVNTVISPYTEMFLEKCEGYRFYIYLALFGLS